MSALPNIGEMPVTGDEWLARYLFDKGQVRADGTVRPEAFIPYRHVELSVTRHLGLEEAEIWAAGEGVGAESNAVLQGRADVQAEVPVKCGLHVLNKPLPGNANHADIAGWPADKPSQKELALRIAEKAAYKVKPAG